MSAANLPQKRKRAVILVMLACSILCALGIWQVKRLAWKQALIAQIESQMTQQPVDFALLSTPYTQQVWRHVRLRGAFVPGRMYRIAPRTLDGQVGFDLFGAFRLVSGQVVIVNRGFVPMETPERSAPFEPNPMDVASIEGIVREAARGSFTPDNNPDKAEWYWPDVTAMSSGDVAEGIYIQQTSALDNPDFDWPKPVPAVPDLPNNHAQYAAFWFGMAALCLMVFFAARRKGYA